MPPLLPIIFVYLRRSWDAAWLYSKLSRRQSSTLTALFHLTRRSLTYRNRPACLQRSCSLCVSALSYHMLSQYFSSFETDVGGCEFSKRKSDCFANVLSAPPRAIKSANQNVLSVSLHALLRISNEHVQTRGEAKRNQTNAAYQTCSSSCVIHLPV